MYLSQEQLLKTESFLQDAYKVAPDVGIGLLNFNSTEHTLECISGIVRSAKIRELRPLIIVLENGSRPHEVSALEDGIGTPARAKIRHEGRYFNCTIQIVYHKHADFEQPIMYIKSDKNLGFCTGYNLIAEILATINASHFLVLNNDARITYGDIWQLLQTSRREEVAAVSPVILDSSGNIWYAGGCYGNFGYNYVKVPKSRDKCYETNLYSGCCVMFHLPTYLGLKGMNDRLFISLDEPEFSRRIKESGRRIVVEPAASITHEVGATIGQKGGRMHNYYWVRNRFLYSQNFNPPLIHFLFALAYIPGRILKWFHHVKNRQLWLVKLDILAISDYFRNRHGPGALWKENDSIEPKHWRWN